jgi:hypothetical protein
MDFLTEFVVERVSDFDEMYQKPQKISVHDSENQAVSTDSVHIKKNYHLYNYIKAIQSIMTLFHSADCAKKEFIPAFSHITA